METSSCINSRSTDEKVDVSKLLQQMGMHPCSSSFGKTLRNFFEILMEIISSLHKNVGCSVGLSV